jgi:hypothetical protein
MTTRTYLAAAILFLAPLAAAAQATDWPASVVCSLGEVTICTTAGCHEASLDTLEIPRMIRFDLKEGVMHAVTPGDLGRRSNFKIIESSDTKLVLQGYENGRAFSAVLDEPGMLAISASTDGTTFSVFASCTSLKFINEAGK